MTMTRAKNAGMGIICRNAHTAKMKFVAHVVYGGRHLSTITVATVRAGRITKRSLKVMRGATVEVNCKQCKEPFTARVADRKRGWAKFCSKRCKAVKQSRSGGSNKYYQSNQRDPDHDAGHEAGLEALHEDYMADCGQR